MKKFLKNKNIRKTEFKNETFFVLNDVVKELTDSENPQEYIQKLKQRDSEFEKGYGQFVHTLEIETKGGKQKMSCVNLNSILKLIEFIPSKKVEDFKKHLYKIGLLKIEEVGKE